MSNAVEKVCPFCGKSFVAHHNRQFYCSLECQKEDARLKTAEKRHALRRNFKGTDAGSGTYHGSQYSDKYKKKTKEFKLTRKQLDQRERLKMELLIRRDTAN